MPKRVFFDATGGADVLRIEDVAEETPGEGEARIRVEAIGLNRAEIMFREGQYIEQPEFPSRLGYEAAGVVEETGPGVSNVKPGDRVASIPAFSMTRYGTYAESAVLPAHALARYPETLTPAEGASIWMQYLTAYGALIEIGRIGEGSAVLITAASSSVGIAAIQMARAEGATAIATTRGRDKRDALLELGAHHVIVTDEEVMPDRVMDITGGAGANLAFDPVAGPPIIDVARSMAQGGTIVEYGALSPEPTPYPLFESLSKGLYIRGYTLFELNADPARLAKALEYVTQRLASGAFRPVIARRFPFDQIADAQRYMTSNQQIGKIVVET